MKTRIDNEQTLTFKQTLYKESTEGVLFKTFSDGRVECFACGHRCKIGMDKEGICKVRFNKDGRLYVPWGYVGGLQIDPIEKKPFYHILPGEKALSFGMLGCDLHCSYCQNWITSQAIRDNDAVAPIREISPEDIISLALEYDAKILSSTYNEPLITSEWAVEIFKLGKKYNLLTSFVSNGNATPEVLEFIRPYVDLYKVDLKGFDDKHYRQLGCTLQNVLDSIHLIHDKKFWLEVLTLIVPDFNDTEGELKNIANFLVSLSPDIPWHVTAFHPDYKMTDRDSTTARTLIRAAEIGYEAGLRFVYAGNLPGRLDKYENTYCPKCSEVLIERKGFSVLKNKIEKGMCWKCSYTIPGIWF
ncbi:MAG: AmmeMemoRadiSam system radical SAM enzyme [Ignavibacteriales bacterium]|nr:AmmeMemoRadiSam system radical SAM enzyme [Ignavibacteriales bacterium]